MATTSNGFSLANSISNKTIRKHVSKRELQKVEKQWVHNFQILCSKDNDRYPKMLRELFENPKSFDKSNIRRYTSHEDHRHNHMDGAKQPVQLKRPSVTQKWERWLS